MKKTLLFIFTILSICKSYAQDITGEWNGLLKFQGKQLRIVFNINKTDSGYTSTMDSPDQGVKGIPVASTSFNGSLLKLDVAKAGIKYEGILNEKNIFTGNFKQAGQSFALDLSKEKIEKEKVVRPQDPVKPYPYYSEDVQFENTKANIKLAGTLTLPNKDGNFPAVILITGSGPQNRDEEVLGHRPFLVLADHLTKNGIAVLRFDDRGIASSTGNFQTATTADFATDVESAVDYLLTRKEINKKKMGLIGHSEGGIIAPMVAARSEHISFIVLLAGTGIPGGDLLLLQEELIGRAGGETEKDLLETKILNKGVYDIITATENTDSLKTALSIYLQQHLKDMPGNSKPAGMSDEAFIKLEITQLTSPWMRYFIRYNPAIILEKVKCPVLALNGAKDLQVPPKENLEAIKKALKKAGNKKVTIKELPNLNHLFQECKTGSPDEYEKIEQTFSPTALTEISEWIIKQVK